MEGVNELIQIALGLATAGAIYGGIRSDLKNMHERISQAEASAENAHNRLTNHIERHHLTR